MKPGIRITRVWSDSDVIELQIRVTDGVSSFTNKVYVGHGEIGATATSLHMFKDHVYGGVFDLRLGEFGPEYANGALHARLHYAVPGQIFVTSEQESAFDRFGSKDVASRTTMYFRTEPVLLNRFISELRSVDNGIEEEAHLEGI